MDLHITLWSSNTTFNSIASRQEVGTPEKHPPLYEFVTESVPTTNDISERRMMFEKKGFYSYFILQMQLTLNWLNFSFWISINK